MPAHWKRVSCLLALLTVSGCGPPTKAFIGASRLSGEPTAVLYVCDDQPHLTVRVYYSAKDAANYTLTGTARKHETVNVPLIHPAAGWTLHGTRAALPPTVTVEADAEDGSGNRLGSSVYFRLDKIPNGPSVAVHGGATEARVLTPEAFSKAARAAC